MFIVTVFCFIPNTGNTALRIFGIGFIGLCFGDDGDFLSGK
jgi:hypothetical protein